MEASSVCSRFFSDMQTNPAGEQDGRYAPGAPAHIVRGLLRIRALQQVDRGICRQLLREQRQWAIAQELHRDAVEAFAQCLDLSAMLLPLGSAGIKDESGAALPHCEVLGRQGEREGLLQSVRGHRDGRPDARR